jgi:hypothetical protein
MELYNSSKYMRYLIHLFHDGPLGVTLHFDDYATPDGNTVTFVGTDAGSIVSGFSTRGR